MPERGFRTGIFVRHKHLLRRSRNSRKQPAENGCCRQCSHELHCDECRRIGPPNAGKRVSKEARQRDSRIREGGGSRKPVCRGNVRTHGKRHHGGPRSRESPDCGEQSETGHELAEELSRACSGMIGGRNHRLGKHQVRDVNSDHRAGALRNKVSGNARPRNTTLCRVRQGYRWIKMRAGNWTESKNQRYQRCAGCDAVGEQSNSNVSGSQLLAHDPGTDDRGQKKYRAQKFSYKAPERALHASPIRFISDWSANLLKVASGRARNKLILRSSMIYASRNARATCSGVPWTAAGSGTPQCAVMGTVF